MDTLAIRDESASSVHVQSATTPAIETFQTVVLSGGGSKGPYGLGVLLALEKLYSERRKKISRIYCGTSVGALNATLAAQGELNELTALYSEIETRDILGKKKAGVTSLGMLIALRRAPFYYFDNKTLKRTIERYAKFSSLRGAHLLICATNYSTGELETFYVSELVDEFLEEEQKQPQEHRRLLNYHRIASQDDLIQALLASTAIPFYLPPVKINKSLYVDGGVGNNTPLRQAAYLSRFLSRRDRIQLEPTFCVINDPVRFKIDEFESSDMFGVVRRTLDIFHNELVRDSHISWERINTDVKLAKEREHVLASRIEQLEGLTQTSRDSLRNQVWQAMESTRRLPPRCDFPLLVVRPTIPLGVQNILHFDPKTAMGLKQHGIADCLRLLEHKNMISPSNLRRWSEEIE